MSDLSQIVAQETQDGRRIVRFLLSAMDGQLPDFQPCHRLDAARLLVKLGFEPAQPMVDRAAAQRPQPQSVNRPSQPAPASIDPTGRVRSELAQIVREETDDGRAAVRFLVSVMQGELPDFKPCHRLDAAKELLHRGFDSAAAEDPREAAPAEPAPDPAELEAQRRLAEDIEFSRHGPLYYESYSYPCVCEDRQHDCKGNELDPQQRYKVASYPPGETTFILDNAEMDVFKARYADYLTRHNAYNPVAFNLINWPWRRSYDDP